MHSDVGRVHSLDQLGMFGYKTQADDLIKLTDEVVHLTNDELATPMIIVGKLQPTQLDEEPMDIPLPRILRGKISATIIQAHGPQLYPNPTAKSQTNAHAAHPAEECLDGVTDV